MDRIFGRTAMTAVGQTAEQAAESVVAQAVAQAVAQVVAQAVAQAAARVVHSADSPAFSWNYRLR